MKKCPVCNKRLQDKIHPDSLPFCSERCRLIDLGDWLTESHKIPSEGIDQFNDVISQDKATKH